jgi:hypothetical protein
MMLQVPSTVTQLWDHDQRWKLVCRLLPLTCLTPDIVEAILDGRQPKGLRLADMLGNAPLAWDEQRMSWGTRFADGEVVTGLRADQRGPVA